MKKKLGKAPGKEGGPTGAAAFGVDPKGRNTGSTAFGGVDQQTPLTGALLFGNDPLGNPTGSSAFGGSDQTQPLKGALLFGNDPEGNPRGSEAFGGSERGAPLKGALLFGNDPEGLGRGSEAFGASTPTLMLRGSMAFGASQLVPERLYKDDVTYDFAGVMISADESSLAGMRKDPRDRQRQRVLRVLQRRLAVEPERLRHGLGENAIPWGRLRRERELDKPLAEMLRAWYGVAPGQVLGVGHVRALLEETERMHSFELTCGWDLRPFKLAVRDDGVDVAYAESAVHKEHEFFVFRAPDKSIFGYVDLIAPQRRGQVARVRDVDGGLVGSFEVSEPSIGADAEAAKARIKGVLKDVHGRPIFVLEEERSTSSLFTATLKPPDSDEPAGRIEDRLAKGQIRTFIEVDLAMPRVLAWAVAAIMADLARLRRKGWPEPLAQPGAPEVESIEQALGPRRRGS